MIQFLSTLLISTVTLVTALQPYNNFREGSCSGINPRPVKASREFVDSLKYTAGASRYNMYRVTSAMPNYSSMREDEFYYDACFTRNTSTTTGNSIAAIFGFGRALVTARAVSRPGIYVEYRPLDASQSLNALVDTVTLTDHKTFAFVSSCWPGVDQRGWAVLTHKPNLDSWTERIVEDHAESLGFKKENFVFIRHDSCRLGLGKHLRRGHF